MDRFNPWDKSRRNVYGHRFRWTGQHLPGNQIQHLLYSYDELATEALDLIDIISPPISGSSKCSHGSGKGQRDLFTLLRDNAETHPTLGKLWHEVTTAPEWVDWDQIQRGQGVVYQFNGQILSGVSITMP